jgi:3-oxoacyl-[acyl-carrier protein] reductase
LLPGTHRTSRIDQLARHRAGQEHKSPEQIIEEMTAANPSRTIGDPSDFGAAAAFLASVQARYITGQNILVDGGNYRGLM